MKSENYYKHKEMPQNSIYYVNASLSCMDLGNIEKGMHEINHSRIHGLHYDIVDGVFNSCFIFGDQMLKVFRRYTALPIIVHLACQNPIPYIKPCITNGADYIAVHYEAEADLLSVFQMIRELGGKPILAFRCDTSVPHNFTDIAAQAEWILKLSVHPGFSGQVFQKEALSHIAEMHQLLTAAGIDKRIEVDGNISTATIQECAIARATMFTGGTSGLFHPLHTLDESIELLEQAISFGGNSYGINDE